MTRESYRDIVKPEKYLPYRNSDRKTVQGFQYVKITNSWSTNTFQ